MIDRINTIIINITYSSIVQSFPAATVVSCGISRVNRGSVIPTLHSPYIKEKDRVSQVTLQA